MDKVVIFDTVRSLLGRGLTQGEVDRLDAAIDAAAGAGTTARTTSSRGVDLIHTFESCRLSAYKDPGPTGLPITIGWGSTTDEAGRPIPLGTTWTQERADARFRLDLAKFEKGVASAIGGSATSQSQFDALVSFAYNVGLGNLGGSTLLRKHKAGDFVGARAEFAKWNKAGGKVLNGLTRRRAAEAEMYGA